MSRFIVQQSPDAEEALADIWISAANRKAVNQADLLIEKWLGDDPENEGEELSEGLYRIIVKPLIAYYEIDELQQRVTITSFKPSP